MICTYIRRLPESYKNVSDIRSDKTQKSVRPKENLSVRNRWNKNKVKTSYLFCPRRNLIYLVCFTFMSAASHSGPGNPMMSL